MLDTEAMLLQAWFWLTRAPTAKSARAFTNTGIRLIKMRQGLSLLDLILDTHSNQILGKAQVY